MTPDLLGLYADPMSEGVKRVTIGVQKAREGLRDYIDAALLEGQRTVIERHGKPVAVLVTVTDAQALFALDKRPDERAKLLSSAEPITADD